MQPEPTKASRTVSNESHPDKATTTAQHGIPSHYEHAANRAAASPSYLSRGDGQASGEGVLGQQDDDTAGRDEDEDGALKTSSLPKEWISENENASKLHSQTSASPGSSASKKTRTISALPNEILTHALSHLTPSDLASVSLVSQQFHDLVTTPHAWRAAFTRFFPGPASLDNSTTMLTLASSSVGPNTSFRSDKRVFCRLTALATWRSEYILRTGLLRSLARGKPLQTSGSSTSTPRGTPSSANAIMMYNSQLFLPVSCLDATFGSGPLKRFPRFVHGSEEGRASASDPLTGRVDNWGLNDYQIFHNFEEDYIGTEMWGLGAGEIVGLPNVLSVSQAHGMLYGEGVPNGKVYFRSTDEARGRVLNDHPNYIQLSEPDCGIPGIDRSSEAISSLWLAKSAAIPRLTDGLIGILSGSSVGVLTAYSLGSYDLRDDRLGRGELTARWILSPGVPIIAIAVDESHSLKRQAQNRVWAVALNALGEVFYITKFPKRSALPRGIKLDYSARERLAWSTGRTVLWNLVEPSRRTSRPDPYGDFVEGSYSPFSSWDGMCLSKTAIANEICEIEKWLRFLPKHFQKRCLGWDMRRRLEVDFANDDGNFAGESVVVFRCGLDEGSHASVRRYTRLKVTDEDTTSATESMPPTPDDRTPIYERDSIFGTRTHNETAHLGRTHGVSPFAQTSSREGPAFGEWRCSDFSFGAIGGRPVQLTTTTLDCSAYATVTLTEDPVLGLQGSSSSTSSSTYGSDDQPITASSIPGERACFIAAGTKSGTIYVWNCRAPPSKATDIINTIDPVRVIYTDSPEVSCLGMTALQIVHGGNDGLVQAWDTLASSGSEPVRTLNSRFSSKARRRLLQAQTSAQGVGINMFAAGAICLDPDPTVLRGMVSLGTHLRYWSYSSLTADQHKGSKRNRRRTDRGSNSAQGGQGQRFSGAVRNAGVKAYILNERRELEQENARMRRESERWAARFGAGLLSEEEAIAYAAFLSQETLAEEEQRRSSRTATPEVDSSTGWQSEVSSEHTDIDADLAEAIRLSLDGDRIDTPQYTSPPPPTSYNFTVRDARNKSRHSPRSASSRSPPAESSNEQEMADVRLALELSLAEEESLKTMSRSSSVVETDDFPALQSGAKGKGKSRE